MVAAVVARRDVIAEYEAIASAAGVHAGLVDLASFNVMNAVIGAGSATSADWLLVTMAPEGSTLAIGRGADLMFYRHRAAVDEEPLSVARASDGDVSRGSARRHQVQPRLDLRRQLRQRNRTHVRTEIQKRLGVPVEPVDVRAAAELGGRITASTDVLEALAAPVGVLLRDRKAA